MTTIRETAFEAMKEGMTSGTSGVGQATHGGSDEEEDEEDTDHVDEKTLREEASSAFSEVVKEWVKDPSETADTMRWRNTETGEYRYQEAKPGEGESAAAESDEGPVSVGDLDPGTEATIDGDPVTIDSIEETDEGTLISFTDEQTGEEFSIYADVLDGVEDENADEDPAEAGRATGGGGEMEPSPEEQFEENFVELEEGVYGQIQEIDPFDGDTWPDKGDSVKVEGGAQAGLYQDATGGGPLMGPDGKEYLEIDSDSWNKTMHIQLDSISGAVQDELQTGEYEVETEWEARFANSIETGEFSEQGADGFMNVRDIQHHASDVNNPELLADALEIERDSRESEAAKRAMEGRIRALGEDPQELLPGPEPGSRAGFGESDYDSWSEKYSPENVVESTVLSDYEGVEPGVSSKNMAVQELEGSDRSAFVTQYTPNVFEGGGGGMSDAYRDEIVCLGHFAREAGVDGSVVPVAHDTENGEWTAVMEFGDGIEAEEVSNTPSEWADKVDYDEAMDKFATMILGGALDLHTDNVMVSEEGEIGFHDLDHADVKVDRGMGDGYDRVANCSAKSLISLVSHREHQDLPEVFRDWIDASHWQSSRPDYRKYDMQEDVVDALTERAQQVAVEIVDNTENPAEELLYEPDSEYSNEQDSKNDTIIYNLETAYEDATGEEVSLR